MTSRCTLRVCFVCVIAALLSTACMDAPQENPQILSLDAPPPSDTPPPTHVTAASALCLPRAAAYAQENIPQLPAGLLASVCEAPTESAQTESLTHIFSYDPDAGVFVSEQRTFEGSATSTFTLNAQQQVVEIVHDGVTGFYVSSRGVTHYWFDDQGRLTHKIATEIPLWGDDPAPTAILEKFQVWDADLLRERTEYDGLTGDLLSRFSWTYDAEGRLSEGKLELPQTSITVTAAWQYDAQGHPSSVTRAINNTPYLQETWTWSAEGLSARTYEAWEIDPQLGVMAYDLPALDQYDVKPTFDYDADPWRLAVFRQQGTCQALPQGPGHGFPSAEPDNNLGLPTAERPNGIGRAYGYDGYGWWYGDKSWYGHGGVGTEWPSATNQTYAWFKASMTYDPQARMTQETLTWTTPGDAPQTDLIDRHRTFDAQGLATDTATLHQGQPFETQRTVRFQHDPQGRLLQRELLEEGTRLEFQTWTYDAQGRLISHGLVPESLGQYQARLAENDQYWGIALYHILPDQEASMSWGYDAQGHVVSRSASWQGQTQTLTYDSEGRLVATRGTFGINDSGSDRQLTYDAQGRLVSDCTLDQGRVLQCTTTTFDDAGRVLSKAYTQPNADPHVIEAYAYRCAP